MISSWFKTIVLIFVGIHLLIYSDKISNSFALISKTKAQKNINKGVWVTVFSEKKAVCSRKGVMDLIESCKKAGINEIYLQLYRSGQAYYDSQISDRTRYEEIVKEAGIDTIELLLREAKRNDIKVFAWINVLSLAQNKKAAILMKYGTSVLTRDQYLRTSIRTEEANESDKYYLRDDQIFLEPGDPRVTEYLVSIAGEIVDRYPLISGIHLDYVRYPHPVPFVPGSRFNKYGLTYGYGELNIKRFKEDTKLNPLSAKDNEDISYKWDDWKREQVTNLVEKISKHIKGKSKDLLVSCAVMPSPERAYSIAFQDWPLWLEKEMVDYVVIMNYTSDDRLAESTAKSALAHNGKGKIFVGIGAFLLKNNPEVFLRQYGIIASLNPDGIVLFSYDEVPDAIVKNINNGSHAR